MTTSFLTVVLALLAQTSPPPALSVHLATDKPRIHFSKDILGVNLDSEDALEPGYTIERYYESMGPIRTPVIRFPGGLVSNYYHWAQTLGPVEKRTPQWDYNHGRTFPPVCGAGEYLKLLHRTKARGMITLNVCDGTAQEAMAWVAFCRGRIGDKRVIGRDKNGVDWKTVDYWAQKRLEETGLYAPVDVVYWELGNECVGGPRFSGKEFSTATDYSPVARAFARKIRQIDQSVSLGWIAWDDKVMGKETDLMDFFIIHHYAGLPVYGDKIMMWNTETLTGTFQCPEAGEYAVEVRLASNGVTPEVIKANKIPEVKLGIDGKVLKTMTLQPNYETVRLKTQLVSGEHRMEVTFTNDYGAPNGIDTNVDVAKGYTVIRNDKKTDFVFPDKDTDFLTDLKNMKTMLNNHISGFNKKFPNAFTAITEFNRMECNNFNLMSALYVAEFLRICSQMPRLQTVEIWDACGWNFGIYKSYAHTRRPTYFTYMMMKELQDRQIPISGLSENDSIRILATRNSMGSEAAILVINLDKPSRTIQFSLPAGQRFIGRERQGFSGPSLTTDNEKGIKIAMNTQPMTGDVRSIEVPEYSVTLILGEISQK